MSCVNPMGFPDGCVLFFEFIDTNGVVYVQSTNRLYEQFIKCHISLVDCHFDGCIIFLPKSTGTISKQEATLELFLKGQCVQNDKWLSGTPDNVSGMPYNVDGMPINVFGMPDNVYTLLLQVTSLTAAGKN